jgi:hypothetical protein
METIILKKNRFVLNFETFVLQQKKTFLMVLEQRNKG